MIQLPLQVKKSLLKLSYWYQQQVLLTPINNERDFIRRTVNFFACIPPITSSLFSISFRSIKTDNKYFAWLQQSRSIQRNPDKEELGDILFIVKFLKCGILQGKTTCLIQAKFSRGNNWHIDNFQFDFMLNFPDFKLGNKRNFIHNRIFHLVPTKKTWSTYVFTHPTEKPIFHTTTRIHNITGNLSSFQHQQSFTYYPHNFYAYFQMFLYNLLISKYGEFLSPSSTCDIKDLIDTIYRHIGWAPDPPAEFTDQGKIEDDEDSGFGIIEITIDSSENLQ